MRAGKIDFITGKLYVARTGRDWMVRTVYSYPTMDLDGPFNVPEHSVFMYVKEFLDGEGQESLWSVFLCGDLLVLAQRGLLEELK